MNKSLSQSYIQNPTKTTRIPSIFFGISCSGVSDRKLTDHVGSFERVYSSSSIAMYEHTVNLYSSRWENNDNEHDNPYHAVDELLRRTAEHKSVWWVTTGINRCFSLLRLWDFFEDNVFTFPVAKITETKNGRLQHGVKGFLSLGDKSEICIFKYRNTTIRAVSYENFGNMSLEECLIFAGYPDDAKLLANGEDSFDYTSDLVIQRSISRWFSYIALNWKKNDLGMFGLTSSQLSHNAYKRKFLNSSRVIFRKPELDRIERASLFGGRAEIWFNGDAIEDETVLHDKPEWYTTSDHILETGTIYRIDISSMYPWIFSNFAVPGECIAHGDKWSVFDLQSAIQDDYIVCAAVKLSTRIPEYPVRSNEEEVTKTIWDGKQYKSEKKKLRQSVKFPKGEFSTVLVGPELESACNERAILECFEMAVYKKSLEYQDYFQFLIHKRYESKILQNKPIESFWKILANSFGGKLAQKNCGWQDANGKIECPIPWGEYYLSDADTGEVTKCRSLGWYAQKWSAEKYNPNSRPIVWSYICSIGRWITRCIRELCPKYSILQQDTDGFYVTHEAIEALIEAGLIDSGYPGSIRIVSKHRHARFLGPRNYFADYIPTMSGVSALNTMLEHNRYISTTEAMLGSGRTNEAPKGIRTSNTLVTITCDSQLSRDFIHGWAMPDHHNNPGEWMPYCVDPMADLFRGKS